MGAKWEICHKNDEVAPTKPHQLVNYKNGEIIGINI